MYKIRRAFLLIHLLFLCCEIRIFCLGDNTVKSDFEDSDLLEESTKDCVVHLQRSCCALQTESRSLSQ